MRVVSRGFEMEVGDGQALALVARHDDQGVLRRHFATVDVQTLDPVQSPQPWQRYEKGVFEHERFAD